MRGEVKDTRNIQESIHRLEKLNTYLKRYELQNPIYEAITLTLIDTIALLKGSVQDE